MRTIRRQSGLTMMSFLFVVAVAVVVTVVGFRVLPAYIEYFSVERALKDTLSETRELSTPAELRAGFQRRADAGYIESVRGSDIVLTRVGNAYIGSAAWTRKLHLLSNVYLLIEFEARAER